MKCLFTLIWHYTDNVLNCFYTCMVYSCLSFSALCILLYTATYYFCGCVILAISTTSQFVFAYPTNQPTSTPPVSQPMSAYASSSSSFCPRVNPIHHLPYWKQLLLSCQTRKVYLAVKAAGGPDVRRMTYFL
jgi:hypothetical protein